MSARASAGKSRFAAVSTKSSGVLAPSRKLKAERAWSSMKGMPVGAGYVRLLFAILELCRFGGRRVKRDKTYDGSAAKEATMSETKFPAGWDEERVSKVLSFYNKQSEDEAVQEDEACVAPTETVMSIPHELVSAVRELIAKHQR